MIVHADIRLLEQEVTLESVRRVPGEHVTTP